MSSRDRLGGIIHTYQKYDPVNLPSPTAEPPDLVSPAMEHLLFYGSTRRLTPEGVRFTAFAASVKLSARPAATKTATARSEGRRDIIRSKKREHRPSAPTIETFDAIDPWLKPQPHVEIPAPVAKA